MMIIKLPKDFLKQIKQILDDDYEAFIKSLHREQTYGLRVNRLKVDPEMFYKNAPFKLQRIPWIEEGFYYIPSDRPGKHPYHEAGLYYIQDPSAMAVVELMDPKEGEIILDLAAAPGGKATQIATKMNNKGLLVANEIHPKRANVLSENVERMGITNCVVTNERPENLSRRFKAYFDRILVDAPCSGEGMFRKNHEAINEWSLEIVRKNAERQLSILEEANRMLKKGGRLVYSTCTFSLEENEHVIQKFIERHPEYKIEKVKSHESFQQGILKGSANPLLELQQTVRLWPHQIEGEGHFIAVLHKQDGKEVKKHKLVQSRVTKQELKWFRQFAKKHLTFVPKGMYTFFGNELYITPKDMISMNGLRIKRAGWHLGTNKRNRFEPSHALALALKADQIITTYPLSLEKENLQKYLQGETFPAEGEKGWYVLMVDHYPLGWGKIANAVMKNHYPKGLRWRR